MNASDGMGYVPCVHRLMALLLLFLGLGVVFLGAWLKDTGWTGWALPVLIVGGLFVFGAGWAAMEIPHELWRRDQPLDHGPPEGTSLLTAGVIAALALGLLIALVVWVGGADGALHWFE